MLNTKYDYLNASKCGSLPVTMCVVFHYKFYHDGPQKLTASKNKKLAKYEMTVLMIIGTNTDPFSIQEAQNALIYTFEKFPMQTI